MWFGDNHPAIKDFSPIEVDIHSHLIPGIDDGSPSTEESVNMLRWFHRMGYRKVITTPHVMSDFWRNTNSDIKAGLNQLRRAIAQENIPIEIEAAAEYYIDFDFHQKITNREPLLTFGKCYLLVEMSTLFPPEKLNDMLFELQMEKYKPVLAHPERYPYYQGKISNYEQLAHRGVLFQINGGSLIGFYGYENQKTAQKLIEAGMVSFIGTDMHNIHATTYLEKLLSNKWFIKLIESGKLLNPTL